MGIIVYCIFLLFASLFQTQAAKVSCSGVSSGAAMAVQFHVANSELVMGAGVVAGAPYYCAKNNLTKALVDCSQKFELIDIPSLTYDTADAHKAGNIDSPDNLFNSSVYLYSGTLDIVVNPGVMKKTEDYYNFFKAQIKTQYDIQSEHAFITDNYGNNCSTLASPFINNCSYDQAKEIFTHIYGPLNPYTVPGNLHKIRQTDFLPKGVTLAQAYLDETAYLYYPTACTKGGCEKIHVAFHGCLQTQALLETIFPIHTGFLRWAESNNIIVLFPQALASVGDESPNPKGCWDWWGYSGPNYAYKSGYQIATVKNIVDYIILKGLVESKTEVVLIEKIEVLVTREKTEL